MNICEKIPKMTDGCPVERETLPLVLEIELKMENEPTKYQGYPEAYNKETSWKREAVKQEAH